MTHWIGELRSADLVCCVKALIVCVEGRHLLSVNPD